MKFIKVLLTVLCLLVLLGLFLPTTTHVERRILIDASPQQVFSFLNDYRKFNQWSPWLQRDPNMDIQYSGPSTGVASRMQWQSDHEQVGSGAQEIIISEPYSLIKVRLEFGGSDSAEAFFTLNQEAAGTLLVWGFDMPHGWNLLSRYFGLMMDSWVGPDYEAGLDNLKQLAEAKDLPKQ